MAVVFNTERLVTTLMHKKIPMVVYEYKPAHRFSNEDDCLGKSGLVFKKKVEILKLADGDTSMTNIYAKRAIYYIRHIPMEELPKKIIISPKLM